MTKKIFRSIIFGSVITLLVSFVFIMGILYEYFNNQLLSELRNEATLAELGVEEYGVDYLENIIMFLYLRLWVLFAEKLPLWEETKT